MSLDWFADVLEFHKKLAPSRVARLLTIPTEESVEQRIDWIQEELFEFVDAGDDIAARADAITDAIYFFVGMAIDHGIDLRPVWDAVHAANMAKEGGETRADGKLMKPPGWQPPDIAGVLAKQGPIV